MRVLAFAFGLFLSASMMFAADPNDPGVDLDVRWMAMDLVDDMVFSWKSKPPFASKTDITLVEISAPVGLDVRFRDTVENRLYELLRDNKDLQLQLVYCGICQQWVALSTPQETLFGRGIDHPDVLSGLIKDAEGRKALSLVFDAEGRDLVLNATIFELAGSQRILWAQRLSTASSSRRLLRESYPLISAEQARSEQEALIRGRDPIQLSTRLTGYLFNPKGEGFVPPLMFVEQSVEGIMIPRYRQRAGVTVGFSSIRDQLEAWSVGGRVMNLMFRERPSLSQPDLYWFVGFSYVRMKGPLAAVFADKEFDLLALMKKNKEPRATLMSWQLGLEAHLKYTFGLQALIQFTPGLRESDKIATENLLIFPYQSYGGGIVIRW